MGQRDEQSTASADAIGESEAAQLIAIARRSMEAYVRRRARYAPDLADLPESLRAPGASFVTLCASGELRGCIGSVVARMPLAEDVAHNAIAAATSDPRFAPVEPRELEGLRLEVTILTPPEVLPYDSYEELVRSLRPGIDGVMLTRLGARGLLLPQVWSRVPDPRAFLDHVCWKAGLRQSALHELPPSVTAWTFQVRHFHEPGYQEPA